MKRILGTIFAMTLTVGTSAVVSAQNTSNQNNKTHGSYESKSTNTTTTDTGTTRTTADTYYGRVEEYNLGKSLKISTPGKTEGAKTYALDSKDETYHIAPSLKVGDWVSVTEKTDNHGKKIMTIARSKEHASHQQ